MKARNFLHPFLFGSLLIFVLSLFALRSLLSNPFYTSHDGFTHTARIAAYYKSMVDGQFPPRWAADLNGKFGSPIFTYIYPAPYFVGSLFHLVGFSFQDSFRYILFLGFLASGINSFLWLRFKFGNLAGLIGALFYIYVPYRFSNVYVRAAYAESLSYAVVPLIFLSIDKIFSGSRRWMYVLILSTAGMLLTHNLVSAIFLPIIIVRVLWLSVANRKILNSLQSLASLVGGFLLSAFIYLPDLFERQFIKFDSSIVYFREHFVTFWQLIKSPWGYGFDMPGTVNDQMSFQLGLAQILVFLLFISLICYKIFLKDKKFSNELIKDHLLFISLIPVSIFLMLDNPLTRQVWESLPGLKTIVDFPWRFLGVTSFSFAYITALFLSQIRFKKLAFVFLCSCVIIANRNHIKINEALNFPDPVFINYTGTSTATSNEFTPVWHKNSKFAEQKNVVEQLSGKVEVLKYSSSTREVRFTTRSLNGGEVRINRFYFPETEILKIGAIAEKQKFEISGSIDDEYDLSGTMVLKVPPGESDYVVRFFDSKLRSFANVLSIISLIVLILFLLLDASKFLKSDGTRQVAK